MGLDTLIDANTAEVIVAVDGLEDLPVTGNNWGSESFSEAVSWDKIVTAFVDAYPTTYKPNYYSEGIVMYQKVSEEEARRQKEINQRKPSNLDQ